MNTLTKLATAIALTIGISGSYATETVTDRESSEEITRFENSCIMVRDYDPVMDNRLDDEDLYSASGKVVEFSTNDESLIEDLSTSESTLNQFKEFISQNLGGSDLLELAITGKSKITREVAKQLFDQYEKLNCILTKSTKGEFTIYARSAF